MKSQACFAFTRTNFVLLGIAIAIILLGYLLMSGSGSTDTQFNPEIFNTLRTVVAPAVCFVGYVFIIVAILWPAAERKADASLISPEAADAAAEQNATPQA